MFSRQMRSAATLLIIMQSALVATTPSAETQTKPLKVLLLTALPASGKSEVRRYLSTLNAQECRQQFGIGSTIQIDDFPYVHMMRRYSDELTKRGQPGAFFLSPAFSFRDAREWGTLMHLINEDYNDIVHQKKLTTKAAAQWLFDRFDAARTKAGVGPLFKKLSPKIRAEIAVATEADAKTLLQNKIDEIDKANNLSDKTIVIEFSRGGADSAPLPLPAPYGYQYSLGQLSPELLEQASILYIQVSPEESRRKNEARANPNDPGSILHHGVPRAVMYMEYGCDDIDWLLKNSDKPNTVCINAHGKTYHLPLGRFDNREDKTTFTHQDQAIWSPADVSKLHAALKSAFEPLVKNC